MASGRFVQRSRSLLIVDKGCLFAKEIPPLKVSFRTTFPLSPVSPSYGSGSFRSGESFSPHRW